MVRTVVSELAMDAMGTYRRQSARQADLLAHSLQMLASSDLPRHALLLSGYRRPVWYHSVEADAVICYVFGTGSSGCELRIIDFGSNPERRADLRTLLRLSGDMDDSSIPARVNIEERVVLKTIPSRAELPVPDGCSLATHLHSNIETHATSTVQDPLHGRRFRVLTGANFERAHVRLSPQQERVLSCPLPLLVQGVAGSGKTTMIAHRAHRLRMEADSSARILLLVYTQELKDFVQDLVSALAEDADDGQCAQLDVLTWRELCDRLAAAAGFGPFKWAASTEVMDIFRRATTDHATAEDAYEYVRNALKGAHLDFDRPVPSRQEVLDFPNCPLDGRLSRTAVVDLLENYQYALSVRGCWRRPKTEPLLRVVPTQN